jgi:hypothetical protein
VRAPNQRRLVVLSISVVVAVAAGAAWALGVFARSVPQSAPRDSPFMTIASGSLNGARWTLQAAEQGGQLCMKFHAVGTPSALLVGGVDCGFNDVGVTAGYAGGAILYPSSDRNAPPLLSTAYGPAPNNATQVRVASNEVVPTQPFPRGKGLPEARFWVHVVGPNWPTVSDGNELNVPQLEDASGHPVPNHDY